MHALATCTSRSTTHPARAHATCHASLGAENLLRARILGKRRCNRRLCVSVPRQLLLLCLVHFFHCRLIPFRMATRGSLQNQLHNLAFASNPVFKSAPSKSCSITEPPLSSISCGALTGALYSNYHNTMIKRRRRRCFWSQTQKQVGTRDESASAHDNTGDGDAVRSLRIHPPSPVRSIPAPATCKWSYEQRVALASFCHLFSWA